ncbi:Zinc finger, RING-type [Sesbania bispinosa]|nr:Zinc finger, RING-type [Sesbania bispinosa]
MNNSSNSEPSHGGSGGFDTSGFTYGLAFIIGLVFVVVTIAVACIRLHMSRTPNILHIVAGFPPPQHSIEVMEQGHSSDTSFEGYPKLLYSEVVENKGGSSISISSSCSICLGDYKESDMLRLLPDCGHLYHLACVDPWLRLHSTCPICRKSSLQPPHSTSN